MSFSFASIGHAIASGISDFYKGAKAVEQFIAKVDTPGNQAIVEGLTSLVPIVGPEAVVVERGVFAVAGQVASILTNVSTAGSTALLNAGFDKEVLADFEALIKAIPGLLTGTTTTVPPVTSGTLNDTRAVNNTTAVKVASTGPTGTIVS